MKPKEVTFATNIAAGMGQEEAFRIKMGRPDDRKKSDPQNAASFVHRVDIAAYIRFIKRDAERIAIMDRAELINIVADAIDKAVSDRNLKMVFVGAKRLCDMEGWDAAKKFEHSGPEGGPIEKIERVIVDPKKKDADTNS